MCGICGIVRFDGKSVDPLNLERMHQSIAHRGPDDEGMFVAGPVGIASRRLSIIDLQSGHQPITCQEGRLTIVYNGEVYNFQDLRRQLSEYCFRTRTDTEVVLYAYKKWGLNGISRLNGMFALAIWDACTHELFLARDRMGIKPLYYACTERYCAFASEIKALLEAGLVRREVNADALDEYLTLQYVSGKDTLFHSVRRLLPGQWIRVSLDGRLEEGRFWEFQFLPPSKPRSEADYAEELRGIVTESIKDQMVADVPVGVFLSGGVDSGIVTTEAARLKGAGIKAFTIDYDIEERDENECTYAALTAKAAGARHSTISITQEMMLDVLPRLIYYLDEPIAEPLLSPSYFLSQAARREVTVVLSGEGADELFAGYRRFKIKRYSSLLSLLPHSVRSSVYELSHRLLGPQDLRTRVVRHSLGGRSPVEWFHVFSPTEIGALTRQETCEAPYGEMSMASASPRSVLDAMLLVDTCMRMPGFILSRVDKMTMANSLELRPPFLDNRVVDFARALPDRMKLNGWQEKYILRRAYKDRVSHRIINRRKKAFCAPFRRQLARLTPLLRESHCAQGGLLNQDAIDGVLNGCPAYRGAMDVKIWTLAILELWYRVHIEESLDYRSSLRAGIAEEYAFAQ